MWLAGSWSVRFQKRDIDNLDAAIKSIREGIENGKKLPISEVINEQ